MSAYAIFHLEALHDAETMDEYRVQARPSLQAYGAKPLVLRGQQQVLEGRECLAVVIFEFEDYDRALAWYNSPEYQACKELRSDAADIRVVIVEGVT